MIAAAAKLINGAKRPIVYCGAGVLASEDGPKLLKQLSDIGNIPVTTTLQGLGAYDERDEKSLHMLGMHGSAYANFAMQEADVIIALGARFDDRVTGKVDTFAPAARAAALEGKGGIIHFEIQPKNINKIVEANIPVLGDVVASLQELVPQITNKVDRSAWLARCKANKERYPFTYNGSQPGQKLKPQEVIKALNDEAEKIGSMSRFSA
jgi:acetolactate synthase-1/2/3 large subunit